MEITDDREKGSIQTKAMLFILGIIFGLFLGYFWRIAQEPHSWSDVKTNNRIILKMAKQLGENKWKL